MLGYSTSLLEREDGRRQSWSHVFVCLLGAPAGPGTILFRVNQIEFVSAKYSLTSGDPNL